MTPKERFSHGEFPSELLLFIVGFIDEGSRGIYLLIQLNKRWLEVLTEKGFAPTFKELVVLYDNAKLTAILLSANRHGSRASAYREGFDRDSQKYAIGLRCFFSKRGRHPMEENSAEAVHLKKCSTELQPSLKRYGATKADRIISQVFRQHAPNVLPEKQNICVLL